MADLEGLYRECRLQLQKRLIPFWSHLRDDINGGFYGLVTADLDVNTEADKGCILNSRILWFFSEAYRILGDEGALEQARHAYRFLRDAFWDEEHGGVYWSVTADGSPRDTEKYCFCQAFAIFGLAAYAQAENVNDALSIRDGRGSDASGDALQMAHKLFDLVETRFRDADGYLEAFSADLQPIPNERISENGLDPGRTMNTSLHLLEAYTELYLTDGRIEVRERIRALIDLFRDRIFDPEQNRLQVFFDRNWTPLGDLTSYGLDIEAAWLIDRAVSAIGDYAEEKEARRMTSALTAAVYKNAYREDGNFASLPMGRDGGNVHEARIWWVQAEAVNGFLNGVQAAMSDNDTAAALKYAEAVGKVWAFIRADVIDEREEGEWWGRLNEKGEPDRTIPLVDQWKCPYHNGRMCMEVMRRVYPEDEFLGDEEAADSLGGPKFAEQYPLERDRQEELIALPNEPAGEYNGIFTRYRNPVLTRDHVPLTWRYDLNPKTNPLFMERLGINAVMNAGAIYLDGKHCLVARIEGNDRKSFFGVAESENGIDHFRFRDYPCEIGEAPGREGRETNVYDMRLTQHEDGWIYGVFCSESKDPDSDDLSAAIASTGIARTKDLNKWERLPDLVTKRSPQQRNVVLLPEFVDGKYAFYTRPMDGFIETGSGSGIGFGLCEDITHAVIDEERMTSLRKYHTITEAKNGEGIVPIRTSRGWIHIAHGVRNTAAGLRYVLYAFATDLKDPARVIAEPGGLLLGPRGGERVGDVFNVVFTNGCIVRESGTVYLYYAGSDTRVYVATTSMERLIDYVFHTPADPGRSALCVRQRVELISRNRKYMETGLR